MVQVIPRGIRSLESLVGEKTTKKMLSEAQQSDDKMLDTMMSIESKFRSNQSKITKLEKKVSGLEIKLKRATSKIKTLQTLIDKDGSLT